MSYLHLKDRDLEWSLNCASNGKFSEALQTLKQYFLSKSFSSMDLKFGTELSLSAAIKLEDLELVQWKTDQWNLLGECPPSYENGLFMVNYMEEDHEHYPIERHDVVIIHKYSSNLNEIKYFSLFSNCIVHYKLDYDLSNDDTFNQIHFKKWK